LAPVEPFTHDGIETALRDMAKEMELKPAIAFHPIRVAIAGRTNTPPLFGSIEVLGKEVTLNRIINAIVKVRAVSSVG
jgi:glutamyl-tRNA synthetase